MGKAITLLLVGFAIFFASISYGSNGWVSSGGDIYRDEKNPWFLRNVKTVQYCTIIDRKGISITEDAIQANIAAAIAYWKREFSGKEVILDQNAIHTNKSGVAKVGLQDFVEKPCDGREDLRFVVGAEALTKDQRKYLKDVRRHMGMAVRTNYDLVNLRGRGFIFVGSDVGANRIVGPFSERLWSKKNMMLGVLAHEMGHVFGIPHTGTGLMAETFAEKLTTALVTEALAKLDELPPVLRIPDESQSCKIGREIIESLGLQIAGYPEEGEPHRCLNLVTSHQKDKAYADLVLKYLNTQTNESIEIGTIAFEKGKPVQIDYPYDVNVNFLSLVYLNPAQRVFREDELIKIKDAQNQTEIVLDYLFGTADVKAGITADLRLRNGTRKSVSLHFSPEGHKMHMDVNGRTRMIFKTDRIWFF